MYKQETIVDQYTILGVDVLIKEHQFPNDKEIWYFAFFSLDSEYRMVRWKTKAGLRKKVSLMIYKAKYKENK